MSIVQGEARQDRVAVASLYEAVFVPEGRVGVAELCLELTELMFETRAGPALCDLLQKRDVGRVMPNERDGPIQAVASVDAAHAFVDVPSQYPDLHALFRTGPVFGLLIWRCCQATCMLAQLP